MGRTAKSAVEAAQRDFNGAAVIDDQGNEIAITEDMVREAIRALDHGAYPQNQSHSQNQKAQFSGH